MSAFDPSPPTSPVSLAPAGYAWNPPLSPLQSTSRSLPASTSFTVMTTAIHKPVSARRGSVSASDAYGKHAHINVDPNRSSSSILTIVRVPPPQPSPASHNGPSTHNVFQPAYTNITLQEPPSTHRRHGHHHGHGRRGGSQDGGSERLSFAFTSFNRNANASNEPRGSEGRSSPTGSPRLRPSSPTQFYQHSRQPQPLKEKPRLTPDQLVDLARQSTDPNALPPSISTLQSSSGRPQSPGVSPGGRTLSPSRSSYDFSASNSQSLSALNSAASSGTTPATFTPLPDDIYLPFIDRPAEIASLIQNPPSSKLLALLAQTFPKQPGLTSSTPSSPIPPSTHTPSSSISSTSTSAFPPNSTRPSNNASATLSVVTVLKEIPPNPLLWTFHQLHSFLSSAPRSIIPDFLFIILVRKCIMSHSELIWERLKGALGVPVELDVEPDPEWEPIYLNWKPRDDKDEHEQGEDGIMMMRGRRKRRLTAGSGASAEAVAGTDADEDTVDLDDMDEVDEDGGRKAYGYWDDWDAVMDSPVWARRNSVGSVGGVSLKSLGGQAEESPTRFNLSDSISSLTGVSIEPLLVPIPTKADTTPSTSTPGANMTGSIEGLQDIGEEEEEEEEEEANGEEAESVPEKTQEQIALELQREREQKELREMENDPDLVYPSRIQGLKIKTVPVPQDHTSTASVEASPIATTSGMPLPSASPGHTGVYEAHQAMNTPQLTGGLAHSRSASFPSVPTGKSSGFFATEFLLPSGTSDVASAGYGHTPSASFSGTGLAFGQRSNSGSSLHKLRASASATPSVGSGRGVSAYLAGRPMSAGYAGMGMSSRRSSHGSVSSVNSLDLGHRVPGSPLFPSNFARLAGGPTLGTNNPALRGMSPSTSRFNMNHVKPRSRPPSRSSAYSYTSSTSDPAPQSAAAPAPAEPAPQPTSTPRRAAGVINSGAGMALGILPGGVVVRRRD